MNIEEMKSKIEQAISENSEKIIEIGKAVLGMPELGYREEKTSQYVRSIFDELGIKYAYPLAVTGIKAKLKGKESKCNVCIIGEMDAVKCAGHKHEGDFSAAHACGHNVQIAAMLGCAISFTIPYALGVVDKSHHRELLLGLLCGIVTIPLGCIVSGVVCKISFISLLLVLMPLVIFSGVIAFGLVCFPEFCLKAFKVFGVFITILITVGLTLGIIRFLTSYEVIKGLATIEEGASICVNAAIVISGSFPFMYVLSKVLSKPLKAVAKK